MSDSVNHVGPLNFRKNTFKRTFVVYGVFESENANEDPSGCMPCVFSDV